MTPNFFLVGTTKGGTSSLDLWLRGHPDVATPKRKEMHFFCSCPARLRVVDTLDEYLAAFPAGVAVGESSPCYLYYPDVPSRLAEFSHPRIVVSLRDPVERFWSHYLMNEFYRPTGRTGEEVLRDNLDYGRTDAVEDLYGMGLYAEQLERYLKVFGDDDVLVVFLEEVASAPQRTIEQILRFLGLDIIELDTSAKDKQHVEPRGLVGRIMLQNRHFRNLGNLLLPPQIRRVVKTQILGDSNAKPRLSDQLRDDLRRLYREDSVKLESLIGRSLPWTWYR